MTTNRLPSLAFALALGCSASGGTPSPTPGPDASSTPDATSTPDAPRTPDATSTPDAAPQGNGCAAFCGFLQRASCPNLPAQVQPAQCMATCERQLYVPACDRVWRSMLTCLTSAAPSQFACTPAGDDLLVPSCAGPYQAAFGCIRSINNPRCYGAPCASDGDCSSRCNDVTGRCFELSAPGSCIGLPCGGDNDCPSRCNSAIGACYQL
ncbi:MAG: hypothetical protein U0324_46060 [Polyangiales bacterium]